MPMFMTVTASYEGRAYNSSTALSAAASNALMHDLNAGMTAVANELKMALDKLYTDLAKKHGVPWPMGTSATTLASRSGKGLQSIKDSIKVSLDGEGGVTGSISTGKMTVHETGATITPTRAQYLTVPLTPALNSRGLPLRASAREWDNTFIATSKRGNLIIFQKGPGRSITPLYLLKKSVTIRPRLGMSQMFEDMVPYFERKAIDALERSLNA